jgi:hypothetical protein
MVAGTFDIPAQWSVAEVGAVPEPSTWAMIDPRLRRRGLHDLSPPQDCSVRNLIKTQMREYKDRLRAVFLFATFPPLRC